MLVQYIIASLLKSRGLADSLLWSLIIQSSYRTYRQICTLVILKRNYRCLFCPSKVCQKAKKAEVVSKCHHNFWTKRFQWNRSTRCMCRKWHGKLNTTLISTYKRGMYQLVWLQTHRQRHTHTHRTTTVTLAHAPRVNNIMQCIIYHAIHRYFWVSIHQVFFLKKSLSDSFESFKMIYRIFHILSRRETVLWKCPTLTCYLKRYQTASQFEPCCYVYNSLVKSNIVVITELS